MIETDVVDSTGLAWHYKPEIDNSISITTPIGFVLKFKDGWDDVLIFVMQLTQGERTWASDSFNQFKIEKMITVINEDPWLNPDFKYGDEVFFKDQVLYIIAKLLLVMKIGK